MSMDEIREVEIELKKLREDADRQKTTAVDLKKENTVLKSRNEYLVNKLKEASYVYGEAGKRLLYFINHQINPVTERLNILEADVKKMGTKDNTLGDSVLSLEKSLHDTSTTLQKKLEMLTEGFATFQERVDDAIQKKTTARISVFERKVDAKLNTLRERDLLLSKDVEALKKFEADIEGLDGRLQETAAGLAQSKIDMGKLEQSAKAVMAATRASVGQEMQALSEQNERKMLQLSSGLKQADEKNLGALRLEARANQDALAKQMESFRRSSLKFEKTLGSKIRAGEVKLKADTQGALAGLGKRLQLLESDAAAASKDRKDIERLLSEKMSVLDSRISAASAELREQKKMKTQLSGLVKHADMIADRIDKTEKSLMDNVETFKNRFEKNKIIIQNELDKIDTKIGHSVKQAVTDIQKQNTAGVSKMREQFLADVRRTEEGLGLLGAKVRNMSEKMDERSQKMDMIVKKELEMINAGVKKTLEAASAQMGKENVSLFSTARHELRKDVQKLREENVTLKSEVKHLLALANVVNDLQKNVVVMGRKVDGFGVTVDKTTAEARARLDNEALKAGKEMAGMSARMKADLKDTIAAEKESFARQSAELNARFESLAKGLSDTAAGTDASSKLSASNSRQLAEIDKRMRSLLKEVVVLKKQYKIEMGKLLKEIEG